MSRALTVSSALLVTALLGCGDEGGEETDPVAGCEPPNRVVGDACLAPGVADDGCPAGTLGMSDGSCLAAGIGAEMCAEGFVHDGDVGCRPELPVDACPPGLIAVPGDAACRPVMPCGSGKWGDIPVDATTTYVDAAYPGTDSDGTAQKPWKTITEAIADAPAGGVIAVAQGTYVEDVYISPKPVKLWGVCPERVELAATGAELAALDIRNGASGTEVHGLAVRGPAVGLFLSGSQNVVLDRLWVHDVSSRGINVQSSLGATSVTITGSLIEQATDVGLNIMGAESTVDGSAVRSTRPRFDGGGGIGMTIHVLCEVSVGCIPTAPARVTVSSSLVELNAEFGMFIVGSEATVEASVVRRTQPRASDQDFGRGIDIQPACDDLTCDPATRATAIVRSSVIEENHDIGLFVMGADATVETTVVRNTLPQISTMSEGRGVNVQMACAADCNPAAVASLTMRSSLIEQNQLIGLWVGGGGTATVETTVVRATLPNAASVIGGRGISMEPCRLLPGCEVPVHAQGTVRGCFVDRSFDIGISVTDSSATIESTLVQATVPRMFDGLFGDGIAAFGVEQPAALTLRSSHVSDSARAGIGVFGSDVEVGTTAVACAAFPLAGDPVFGRPFTLDDLGGNGCGCPTPDSTCKLVTAGLQAPEPLPPPQ